MDRGTWWVTGHRVTKSCTRVTNTTLAPNTVITKCIVESWLLVTNGFSAKILVCTLFSLPVLLVFYPLYQNLKLKVVWSHLSHIKAYTFYSRYKTNDSR